MLPSPSNTDSTSDFCLTSQSLSLALSFRKTHSTSFTSFTSFISLRFASLIHFVHFVHSVPFVLLHSFARIDPCELMHKSEVDSVFEGVVSISYTTQK